MKKLMLSVGIIVSTCNFLFGDFTPVQVRSLKKTIRDFRKSALKNEVEREDFLEKIAKILKKNKLELNSPEMTTSFEIELGEQTEFKSVEETNLKREWEEISTVNDFKTYTTKKRRSIGSLLFAAVLYKRTDLVKIALRWGAQPGKGISRYHESTPIAHAILMKNEDIVRVLAEHCVDLKTWSDYAQEQQELNPQDEKYEKITKLLEEIPLPQNETFSEEDAISFLDKLLADKGKTAGKKRPASIPMSAAAFEGTANKKPR